MTETGLTILNDSNYKEFIAEGVTVVLVSLILQNGKECPYCLKLKAKAETLTHRKIGTLVINDNSEFKREYFKTVESGKSFPVMIVFENGVEKYRRAGDMPVEKVEDFIDNGTQTAPNKGINLDNASINDIKAIIYDELVKLRQAEANLNKSEDMRVFKLAEANIKTLEQMLASRQKG